MTLNQRLFIIVPLVSMLLNLFLFLAVLSAKKTRLIYAFMGLLAGFMAWCTGSLFMRMDMPYHERQVSILIRSASAGQVVYETSARHDGRWNSNPTL